MPGAEGSPGRVVRWDELTEDVELCQRCFGKRFGRLLEVDKVGAHAHDTAEAALLRIEKLAETAEEQEHQAWCELPLRELAYMALPSTDAEVRA